MGPSVETTRPDVFLSSPMHRVLTTRYIVIPERRDPSVRFMVIASPGTQCLTTKFNFIQRIGFTFMHPVI
jgi:hypothetical protein